MTRLERTMDVGKKRTCKSGPRQALSALAVVGGDIASDTSPLQSHAVISYSAKQVATLILIAVYTSTATPLGTAV